ncbi:unnamed protein product [Sphenostylis stenocarpa]|uniref:(S)-hydroxynitrile lyase n=1 Tax=Sphenostylis stenocarpa TaxID=92480 RepID=A0AA86SBV8_9FABA|nr:unnamed protein product [Sphenostylis stenocarpa]
MASGKKHFVLVHGAGHGAWCWYKLKPLLESAGHRVTVLDLAASGINLQKIEDVDTFSQYSEPLLQLLATIPPNEKVILVGHSLGGLNIALAIDKFPEKIAVGVFLTALTPDIEHKPSYVSEKHLENTPPQNWLDCEFFQSGNKTVVVFGPIFSSTKLYQCSSVEVQLLHVATFYSIHYCTSKEEYVFLLYENKNKDWILQDIELAKTLVRPSSLFIEDLSQQNFFSKERYGSVPLASIVCTEDLIIPLNFQHWMIQNAGVNDVVEIKGADHMPMLSKPQELCDSLLQMAAKYA